VTPASNTRVGFWGLAGFAIGLVLLWVQAMTVGGLTGLLQVGESSKLRPFVEERLGDLPLAPGPGHDGQISFAIAADLDGSEAVPLLDHAGYRYRRVLHPWLASLGGLVDGTGIVWGLAVTSALGMGLAAASSASLSAAVGASRWSILGVVANPAMWLATWLLTSDALAAGLGLAGLAAWLRRRPLLAVLLFAAAGLTKDQYLLLPLVIAAHELWYRRPARAAFLASSALPTVAWGLVVTALMGAGLTPRSNLTLPLMGIVGSVPVWSSVSGRDLVFTAIALAGVAVGAVAAVRRRGHPLGRVIAGFVMLALVSSTWVWDIGNNAARAFVLLWVLSPIALTMRDRARVEI
jgi:hypothetical protein